MFPPPLRLLRLANPIVRAVLDSRAHRLVSERLLVLDYVGHRSGRIFRIPLRFASATDDAIVAIALRPRRKLWWRSFVRPAKAVIRLRGSSTWVMGAVAEGADRDRALAVYLARFPRSAPLAADAAVVVFERAHG